MLNEHQITFRVRYPETDAMGVVHHSRYFQYFEMGRIELLRADGLSYAEMEMAGILFVVAKVECKYKAPARYDEELTLTTTVARRTHVRIDHVYTLKRGTTLIAEGATTIACVDRQGQQREIPETMIKDLQTE
jgi:acyl-CoA thioester hydrolase